MAVDEEGHINAFQEKPAQPAPMPGDPGRAMVSMGIYLFNTDYLVEMLAQDAINEASSHDFGKDILPRAVREQHGAYAYLFRDPKTGKRAYWRDVGTIDSYWASNLELIGVVPELDLYDKSWPIWTYQEQLPPAKFVFNDEDCRGMAVDSMVAGGCIVSGACVIHSLLFSDVIVEKHSVVEHSVILPDVDVGPHCRIRNAVIDSGCRIPTGTVIGHDQEADRQRFSVSPKGIVVVTPEMLSQENVHVR
jgi:glucose-1-phosphate adenylyltransferase